MKKERQDQQVEMKNKSQKMKNKIHQAYRENGWEVTTNPLIDQIQIQSQNES